MTKILAHFCNPHNANILYVIFFVGTVLSLHGQDNFQDLSLMLMDENGRRAANVAEVLNIAMQLCTIQLREPPCGCREVVGLKKKSNVLLWPQLLLLVLKRWTAPTAPVDRTVLGIELELQPEEGVVYRLKALVAHVGDTPGITPQSGHYVALTTHEGVWHYCDDATCHPSSVEAFLLEQSARTVYMVLYEKMA
eukprot:3011669-Amphidinium_carterae.1